MARKEWSESKKRFFYAVVRWAPQDILLIRPDLTIEQAESWLGENAKYIEDAMVEKGWEVIEQLLRKPTKESADAEG